MSKKLEQYWYLIFIIFGLAIYGQSFSNEFVWDDEEQIVLNERAHSLEQIPSFFFGSSFNSGGATDLHGVYYKPLMTTAYTLLWSAFGEDPIPFHLFQFLIHLANAFFVTYLLSRFFSFTAARFMGLVFLIHPINSECVLYCANFQDVMFLFFGLLATLMLYRKPRHSFAGSAGAWILTFLLLLASMLSKESGLLFVPMTIIYTLLFDKSKIWQTVFVASCALGLYALLRFGAANLTFASGTLAPITRTTLDERLLTLPAIIFFYFKQFFYPLHFAISQHWIVKEPTLINFYLPLLFTAFIAVIFIRYLWKTKESVFIYFFIWFTIGMGLHSQIVPLDMTVAERWFYFPSIGLMGMMAILMKSYKSLIPKPTLLIASLVTLAALGTRSLVRSYDWRNGFTLYTHDIEINPEAFDLQNNVGVELFRAGNWQQAKIHFEKSIALMPDWPVNWNNLGVAYERAGDFSQAEAIYKKVTETSTYYLAYENYFKILIQQGRREEAKNFVETRALKIFPLNPIFVNYQKYAPF